MDRATGRRRVAFLAAVACLVTGGVAAGGAGAGMGTAAAAATGPWTPQRHLLAVPAQEWSAGLRAMNRAGTVLGVLLAPDAPTRPRIGVWRGGVLSDLGPGEPIALNERDDLVAVRDGVVLRWWRAAGEPSALPLPVGCTDPAVAGLNARGDVAGTVVGAEGRRHVVLWPAAGGVNDLGAGPAGDEWDQARVVRLTDDGTIIGDGGGFVLIGRHGRHGRLERVPRRPGAVARREGDWLRGAVAAASSGGRFLATAPSGGGFWDGGLLGEVWERGKGVVASIGYEQANAMSGQVTAINEHGLAAGGRLDVEYDDDFVFTWDLTHGLRDFSMGDGASLNDHGDTLSGSQLIGWQTWTHDGGGLSVPLDVPCQLGDRGRLGCTEADDAGRSRIVVWW